MASRKAADDGCRASPRFLRNVPGQERLSEGLLFFLFMYTMLDQADLSSQTQHRLYSLRSLSRLVYNPVATAVACSHHIPGPALWISARDQVFHVPYAP